MVNDEPQETAQERYQPPSEPSSQHRVPAGQTSDVTPASAVGTKKTLPELLKALTFSEKVELVKVGVMVLAVLGSIFVFMVYQKRQNEVAIKAQELEFSKNATPSTHCTFEPAITSSVLSDNSPNARYLLSVPVAIENTGYGPTTVKDVRLIVRLGTMTNDSLSKLARDASHSITEVNAPGQPGLISWDEPIYQKVLLERATALPRDKLQQTRTFYFTAKQGQIANVRVEWVSATEHVSINAYTTRDVTLPPPPLRAPTTTLRRWWQW